jgi:hypothetical protein
MVVGSFGSPCYAGYAKRWLCRLGVPLFPGKARSSYTIVVSVDGEVLLGQSLTQLVSKEILKAICRPLGIHPGDGLAYQPI